MICVKLTVASDINEVKVSVNEDNTVNLKVETPIVNPRIPSNYGLITWNGSYLMVS